MARSVVEASAPGSLMLMGEHAVLRGKQALACALDARIRVRLAPREDAKIGIHSDVGNYESDLESLRDDPRLAFVLAVVRRHAQGIPSGFDLMIESTFAPDIGFGSSAAVTVATEAALHAWTGESTDRMNIVRAAREDIRAVQGLGSGADAAAAVWGGVIAYRAEPMEIQSLDTVFPLTVVFSGAKQPTAEVVEWVNQREAEQPELLGKIFEGMDLAACLAADYIRGREWDQAGRMMDISQGFMEALGVNTGRLSEMVYALRGREGIFGAKISGSGLGDCVIGLGATPGEGLPGRVLPVSISREGLRLG